VMNICAPRKLKSLYVTFPHWGAHVMPNCQLNRQDARACLELRFAHQDAETLIRPGLYLNILMISLIFFTGQLFPFWSKTFRLPLKA
jgi:hypothetical protein